jgi:hypothetical protein
MRTGGKDHPRSRTQIRRGFVVPGVACSLIACGTFAFGFAPRVARWIDGGRQARGGAANTSPTPDTLHINRTLGVDASLGYATAFATTKDRLLVGDIKFAPHIAVIDRVSGRLVKRIGNDGLGAGALREPSCITTGGDSTGVWVFDRQRSVLAQLRLDAPPKESIVHETPLTGLPPSAVCATWLSAKPLIYNYTPAFLEVPDRDGKLREAVDVPAPYREHEDLNHSSFAISPSKGHIALTYEYANRIDLIDRELHYTGMIRGPHPFSAPRFTIAAMPDSPKEHAFVSGSSSVAYLGLAASDSLLYAMYSGCGGSCGRTATRVQVFRWNGEFVREFAMDRRLLMIAVSPDDKVLYGVFANGDTGYDERLGEWILPSR